MSQELSVFSRWLLLKVSQEVAINIVAGVGAIKVQMELEDLLTSTLARWFGLLAGGLIVLPYRPLYKVVSLSSQHGSSPRERDHGGKGNAFYNHASGVTHSCCMPLDTQDSHNSV